MRSNGDELASSADILVQLVLQVDEGLVGPWGELDVSEHSTCKVRSDLLRLETHTESISLLSLCDRSAEKGTHLWCDLCRDDVAILWVN